MRFFNSDFLAVIIGSTIILILSLLFYFDITSKVGAGSNEVIGAIIFKKKVAQRKYISQVVWEELEQKSTIYNNDTIRTADLSEARLHLKDGTEIQLNENSMILVSLTTDKIDINFSKGSISAKRNSITGPKINKLTIKSEKAVISLDKSDIQLTKEKDNDLDLTVNKGEAKVLIGSEQKEIKENQKVIVSKDSDKLKVITLSLIQKDPSPDSYVITTAKTESINFSWKPLKTKEFVNLEISNDISFNKTLMKKKTKDNSVTLLLNKGVYYWRLNSLNRDSKKIEYSDRRKFTIIQEEPIHLISPDNESVISYLNAKPLIDFKWIGGKLASSYKVILSRDRNMYQIIDTIETSKNSIAIDTLDKGSYYWKVTSSVNLSEKNYLISSRVYNFNIDKKDMIEPPDLISPSDKQVISKTSLKDITFSWNKNDEITNSRLIIASDNKFKKVVFNTTSKTNFYSLNKDLSKGKYYWKVIGLLNNGKSIASGDRTFFVDVVENIELFMPKSGSNFNADNGNRASVKFSWKKIDIKGTFKVQISKYKDFSAIYKEKNNTSYTTVIDGIEPGKYYCRVLLNRTGVMSTPTIIFIKSQLAKPVPLTPRNGDVIDMNIRNELSLSWDKINDAHLYEIELYSVKDNKNYNLLHKKTDSNIYEFRELNKLEEGRYYWTIQAYELENNKKVIRKSPVVKTFFTIKIGKTLEKTKITSPKIIYY